MLGKYSYSAKMEKKVDLSEAGQKKDLKKMLDVLSLKKGSGTTLVSYLIPS
ncbi:MAG: hypothetical protein Hyperionvirus11_31 [Hyperionvirus sp.]|uniref:Uncharacterized protein n=1 Tax=Hyperionvirus sp. TaxID=2487770 RepID=A0A3G5A928_9VIRU|nr:MAG: hypothetical protein Hyperionvirus11_31 [Hyperionvirus sp.]